MKHNRNLGTLRWRPVLLRSGNDRQVDAGRCAKGDLRRGGGRWYEAQPDHVTMAPGTPMQRRRQAGSSRGVCKGRCAEGRWSNIRSYHTYATTAAGRQFQGLVQRELCRGGVEQQWLPAQPCSGLQEKQSEQCPCLPSHASHAHSHGSSSQAKAGYTHAHSPGSSSQARAGSVGAHQLLHMHTHKAQAAKQRQAQWVCTKLHMCSAHVHIYAGSELY